jgi:hypothetical protein
VLQSPVAGKKNKSMKTKQQFTKENKTVGIHLPPGNPGRALALIGATAAGLLSSWTTPAQPVFPQPLFPGHGSQIGSVFVIAMENHNFTQPNPTNSPQQIQGNPAAPYINSLITPGNPNAAHVSYATAYCNAGVGVHPSEPNYVWAEAGTDFGIHTDADPNPAVSNVFSALHLTAQLDAAGIPWKNYQEDVQLSVSPTNSASGTGGPVNMFNGSTQYNYAVKHNPMAFFPDSAVKNVYPLGALLADLTNNAVGRYNWITPNQYNDAHSSLSGGFTYLATHYSGDQANIAQGDNFLSQLVPQIMASKAYQENGVIIIWWDETENGDGTNRTLAEFVISPLAKGNAYASTIQMNHSSDIKTMEEIFGLPALNNAIPTNEVNASGIGYNNVATVNDLSDLFVAGVIGTRTLSVGRGPLVFNRGTHETFQLVFVQNTGNAAIPGPLWLVLDNLSPNATLENADGTTAILPPLGSPYVMIHIDADDAPGAADPDQDVLFPYEVRPVVLKFLNPGNGPITYDTRTLSVVPAP